MHIPVLNVLILLGQDLDHLVADPVHQGVDPVHQGVDPVHQDAVQVHQDVDAIQVVTQDVSQVVILEQTPEPILKSQANISISSK